MFPDTNIFVELQELYIAGKGKKKTGENIKNGSTVEADMRNVDFPNTDFYSFFSIFQICGTEMYVIRSIVGFSPNKYFVTLARSILFYEKQQVKSNGRKH